MKTTSKERASNAAKARWAKVAAEKRKKQAMAQVGIALQFADDAETAMLVRAAAKAKGKQK